MDLNSRYAILLRHISLGMCAATERRRGERRSRRRSGGSSSAACPQEGIISIGHIYFHGSLIVRLSKHGNTFKIAMKSGKWDARANKMPIFYGQQLRLELKLNYSPQSGPDCLQSRSEELGLSPRGCARWRRQV